MHAHTHTYTYCLFDTALLSPPLGPGSPLTRAHTRWGRQAHTQGGRTTTGAGPREPDHSLTDGQTHNQRDSLWAYKSWPTKEVLRKCASGRWREPKCLAPPTSQKNTRWRKTATTHAAPSLLHPELKQTGEDRDRPTAPSGTHKTQNSSVLLLDL